MREGHASRTAEQNALFRALESALPESRRLFEDPLASAFLTWPLALVARLAIVPGLRQFVPWYIDHRWPGVRSSVVARTRLIDDAITASLEEHTEQLVILGAGFDSRAYRLPCVRDITCPPQFWSARIIQFGALLSTVMATSVPASFSIPTYPDETSESLR